MTDEKNNVDSALQAVGQAAIVVIIIAILVFNISGMVVLHGIVSLFALSLVTSQWWTFSIILSAIIYFGVWLKTSDWESANKIFLTLSLGLIAILLVLHFGLLMEYPAKLMSSYF